MVRAESEYHNWELYKENAAPLERGRNVSKLSNALEPSSINYTQRQEQDLNIQSFERLVRPSEKFLKLYKERLEHHDNTHPISDEEVQELLLKCKVDKDPLVHWLRYIKYHEDTYPSDTNNQFLLMERCTQTMIYHPKYINDTRFIRVCVLYADKTTDPHEQFKFFHTHKIGSTTAIFWLAWAWVAEKKKDFPFAEKIFRKAIQKKAQPVDKVNERYKQFQRRMSRHWLNANAANSENVYDEEVPEIDPNKRSALVGLTEEAIKQNNRSAAINPTGRNAFPLNAKTNLNKEVSTKGGFNIFADDGNDHDGRYDLNNSGAYGDENAPIPKLVKQNERSKENIQTSEAWNERGGLNVYREMTLQNEDNYVQGASSVVQRWAGTGGDSIIAGGTSSRTAFAVFIDEDCNAKSGSSDERKLAKTSKTAERGGLRQRGEDFSIRQSLSRGLGVNKSEIKKDHIVKSAETSDDNKNKDGKQSVKTGFDKKLISKDKNDDECCFAEHRFRNLSHSVQLSSSFNFNLLHKTQSDSNAMSMSIDSCMDLDDTTGLNDDEMEASKLESSLNQDRLSRIDETEYRNISTLHDRQTRKVLFGANTNALDYSAKMNNTSTNSSTVEERDAVGVFGDREETVNTKFAALELSRMFSSPINHSNLCMTRLASDKLLFSANHAKDSNENGFSIFRDEHPTNSFVSDGGDGFPIFKDEVDPKKIQSKSFTALPAFKDDSSIDDDSYDGEERDGDTASFADILNIMKEASPKRNSIRNQKLGLSIFCDDDSNHDGHDLYQSATSTAAFGDISFIPCEGETVDLQEKLRKMTIAKTRL